MNVCVVAEYYPRRRDPVLGVWAHEQARAARDAGADVRVLALERPIPPLGTLRSPPALARAVRGILRQPRTERRDGIEITYVRFLSPPRERSYPDWDRWARPRVERAIESLDARWPVEVVHAHYALPAGGAVRGWARARGRPLVVSVHGGDVFGPLLADTAARTRVADVLRDAAAVLCNSGETLRRAAKLTGSDRRMRVVWLGADAPAELPAKRSRPTIATLGHVVARKRHEDVLRALAREELDGARWVVIGDGPERPRLERLARELGVEDRVEWLGAREHGQALHELARCHVMALPSVDEAFGVAYVEAMACGVPAVASRGEGGPEEIAAVGDGLLLVTPRDPAALAGALGPLLADGARLDALSAGARATAERHFSWARCGAETVAAYRDALSC
jgi:teichuronic acid biosynthesis glycosyltransferase TuaC